MPPAARPHLVQEGKREVSLSRAVRAYARTTAPLRESLRALSTTSTASDSVTWTESDTLTQQRTPTQLGRDGEV